MNSSDIKAKDHLAFTCPNDELYTSFGRAISNSNDFIPLAVSIEPGDTQSDLNQCDKLFVLFAR